MVVRCVVVRVWMNVNKQEEEVNSQQQTKQNNSVNVKWQEMWVGLGLGVVGSIFRQLLRAYTILI